MSLPVVLRDEAQAEFDDAFNYYEQRRAGLGVAFAARVQEVFDRIAANPLIHAVAFADIRKAVVARFPYCVYYRAEQARSLPFVARSNNLARARMTPSGADQRLTSAWS